MEYRKFALDCVVDKCGGIIDDLCRGVMIGRFVECQDCGQWYFLARLIVEGVGEETLGITPEGIPVSAEVALNRAL